MPGALCPVSVVAKNPTNSCRAGGQLAITAMSKLGWVLCHRDRDQLPGLRRHLRDPRRIFRRDRHTPSSLALVRGRGAGTKCYSSTARQPLTLPSWYHSLTQGLKHITQLHYALLRPLSCVMASHRLVQALLPSSPPWQWARLLLHHKLRYQRRYW